MEDKRNAGENRNPSRQPFHEIDRSVIQMTEVSQKLILVPVCVYGLELVVALLCVLLSWLVVCAVVFTTT